MTVVTFALPDESRDFRRLLGPSRRRLGSGRFDAAGRIGDRAVAVFHVGVGDSPARREQFTRYLREEVPAARTLVVSGYAGALRPGVRVGDLVLGENHSAAELLDPVRRELTGEPLHVGSFNTQVTAVETATAKAALHAATGGALAVDMETAWVAAVGSGAGLPTLALRVISDAAGQDFPVPGGVMFDPVRQRPRYLALPAYLVTHPGRIGPFVSFVRGLGPARARLGAALVRVIAALPVV